jgi:hypothetical protein
MQEGQLTAFDTEPWVAVSEPCKVRVRVRVRVRDRVRVTLTLTRTPTRHCCAPS